MAKAKAKTTAPPSTSANDIAELSANFGWSQAFLKSHPELENIFNQAVNGGWSQARFVASVQDTAWFKQHSDVWRKNEYLSQTDPSTFKQRKAQYTEQLRNMAGQYGIQLTSKQLAWWGTQGFMMGWGQPELQNVLASTV